LMCRLLLR